MTSIDDLEIMCKRIITNTQSCYGHTTYYTTPYEMEYIANELMSFVQGYKALKDTTEFDKARGEYLENNP